MFTSHGPLVHEYTSFLFLVLGGSVPLSLLTFFVLLLSLPEAKSSTLQFLTSNNMRSTFYMDGSTFCSSRTHARQ